MTDYTLHYWPISFRGHFIRFTLAQAGVSWDEAPLDPSAVDYPFFAQPLLTDHATGRRLSQTPAILFFLGRTHGLIQEPDNTLRLVCDGMDVLYEITRYHGAQMWDTAAWDAFINDRFTRWLEIHERFAAGNGVEPAAGFLFGAESPTLADLTLTALWHTMADKLPELRQCIRETAPTVLALADRVAAGAEITAVRADWPEPLYCGGQIEASIREMLARDDARGPRRPVARLPGA